MKLDSMDCNILVQSQIQQCPRRKWQRAELLLDLCELQLYISQEDGLLRIKDLIPRMPVQWLLKTLLIQCMSNQPNGASQDKEAIQVANLDDVCDLRLHSPKLKIPDCLRKANSRLPIVRMWVQQWQSKGNF